MKVEIFYYKEGKEQIFGVDFLYFLLAMLMKVKMYMKQQSKKQKRL